jgi:hypothetical protein
MAGIQGTPSGAGSMGMETQATPSVFTPSNQPNANMMSPAVQPMPQPSMGGGKGAGPMQPQKTAMGTPIVYGNVYSSNTPPSIGNPNTPNTPIEPAYDATLQAADGTTSVPAYAYGTTSVSGYARGTVDVEDPWDWSKSHPMTAPMAAEIKPSTEQALGRMPDRTEQQLASMAMGKGIDAADKGITAGYNAYKMAGPLAEAQAVSQAAATDMALGGLGGSTNAAALIEAASTGAALAEGGAAASALGTAGAGAGAAGLGGALGAGGTAAMAALASNPVGWAIGAGLLAKKLKIF